MQFVPRPLRSEPGSTNAAATPAGPASAPDRVGHVPFVLLDVHGVDGQDPWRGSVAEQLRRSLPRFAGLTDREVLTASFALHDAQQVIAAGLGFASWADLEEVPPVLDRTPPELQRSLAQVFVTDFAASLAFYRDTLGFDVVFTYGEPPFYGEVARGNAAFNLRHVDETPFVADRRDTEQSLSVAIATTDAKTLFLMYQEAGVDFQERLRTKPWGADEFVVRDPDGNLILFGSLRSAARTTPTPPPTSPPG